MDAQNRPDDKQLGLIVLTWVSSGYITLLTCRTYAQLVNPALCALDERTGTSLNPSSNPKVVDYAAEVLSRQFSLCNYFC